MNNVRVTFGSGSLLSWPLAVLLVGALACDSTSNGFPTRDAGTATTLNADGGGIQVQTAGTANNCPALLFTVSPPDGKVDDNLDVNATASDPDPSDQLSLTWSATAGFFANPKVAHTTYTCSVAGPQTITVSVSDGRCTTARSAAIYCYARGIQTVTGGAVDGGMAGTGGAGGGAGGMTGSGGSGTGGMGMGAGGSGSGTGGAGVTECMGSLTMQVTHAEGQACEKCTNDNCSPSTDGCDDGLNSDVDIQLCRRLYCCIRVNGCSVFGDANKCLCGTDTTFPCVAPNGPCLIEVQDAAKSKDPATIRLRWIDPSYPLGRASNLANCRGTQCGRQDPMQSPLAPEYLNSCMIQ